jgi:hypothetical protein
MHFVIIYTIEQAGQAHVTELIHANWESRNNEQEGEHGGKRLVSVEFYPRL